MNPPHQEMNREMGRGFLNFQNNTKRQNGIKCLEPKNFEQELLIASPNMTK